MLSPKDVIKKSYLKQKLTDKEFEGFKEHFESFQKETNENESEEYNKNLITEFLNNIGYANTYKINTSGRVDLAIYKNNIPEVLIEAKSLKNKSEMIKHDNLNKKSLQEAVLYYMREKIKHKNFNIRHIIITNNIEWFIFDATEINRIATNKRVEKLYNDFEIEKTLFSQKTDEFYKHLGIILQDDDLLKNIKFARFYLKDKQTNTQLKYIYKLLSPTHLLKLYSEDDSNTLNKNFYYELLHIMGLEETKEGSKKVIGRKSKLLRDDGSLLESTILKLKIEHDISNEGKLFETALELNITWLNRILFLKLLEARLLTIHNGKYPKFLSYEVIDDFDKLNTLFFEILARRINERESIRIEEFKNIPYLNSSLFEITPLERKYLKISELKNNTILQKSSKTILKSQSNELSSIEYLLKFLNAYDFGSNEKDEFKDEHNTLINSSVLGLIFEKLNGYKDGSFFTPSFVTMYMTKESIRKTVLEKFNKYFKIQAENFHELKNYCEANFYKDEFLTKANDIVNSITIVDPAVGSGHFLVSALNELLSIKSELKILKGLNHIQITNENDELYIETQDGFFEYTQTKEATFLKETQNIQELIFNEKLHIIENQLFGVDININSVKITQLRLWIELLKESYYDENNELVTLPNIDINIKTGNSLVSKYPLKDSETKNPLLKEKLNDYKKYVKWYKETNDKAIKKEVVGKIEDIKKSFSQKLKDGSPELTEFKKLIQGFQPKDKKKYIKGYIEQFGFKGLSEEIIINFSKQEHCILYARFGKEFNPNNTSLFGDEIKLTAKEKKTQKTQATALLKKINKKYEIIKEFEDAEIFENSFEWRFEFPEVLDEDGEFVGFDIVIGNPPYGAGLDDKTKTYYKKQYENVHMRTIDTFNYFISMSSNLLKDEAYLSFIIPNNFLYQNEYEKTREYLLTQFIMQEAINLGDNVFDDANVPTCIVECKNGTIANNYNFNYCDIRHSKDKLKAFENLSFEIYNKDSMLSIPSYTFGISPLTIELIKKVKEKSYLIDDIALEVASGISTGGDKVFRVSQEFVNKNELETDILENVLVGREINKYVINDTEHQLIYTTKNVEIEKHPSILNYLNNFEEKLSNKRETKKGTLPWWCLHWSRYKELFTEEKILLRQTADSVIATYDDKGYFALNSLLVFKIDSKFDIDYKFALSILNSKLTTFIYKNYTGEDGRDFAEVKPKNIRKLYIPKVDKSIQDEFVKIVNKILELKKQNKNSSKLECLIDKKVYSLYDLDEEEINLIESAYNG
nr:TaqI-like C-terminal specificity domain-containing protein [Sulfurimonas sp. SAG-AH-194-L11]